MLISAQFDASAALLADQMSMYRTIEGVLVARLAIRIADYRQKPCFQQEIEGPIDGAPADAHWAMRKFGHKVLGAEVAGAPAYTNEYDASGFRDATMRFFHERRELRPGALGGKHMARAISKVHPILRCKMLSAHRTLRPLVHRLGMAY